MSLLVDLPQRLLRASDQAQALPPSQGEGLNVSAGYALQRQGVQQREARGERVSGWKVAFAGEAAQRRFGLSEPVYGALTDAMQVAPDEPVALSRLIRPKLEIEVALTLGRDLAPGFHSDEALLDAIADIAPAFEIADCRWQGWSFAAGAFLADNAAAGLYCLGEGVRYQPEQHRQLDFCLSLDGRVLGEGRSSLSADSPHENLCWLIRRVLADRQHLRAGQVILSGALLPPIDVQAGEYRLDMLGTRLALRFTTADAAV
ncbi:2-keto-4-pentenoate hydratase [Pseudomonas cremoricolorata]|uniref:2-keto-4-pentenoate hydratase n=1 Tax=Pseudomonas cremoricolorata TaxID=157783 RepID=UPI00048F9158|nr:fumarylacetoacetate hydrolase family protein [Pseudomonas cremoricolorata]